MRESGWLIGDGMATALCAVPALPLDPGRWAPGLVMSSTRGTGRARDHLDRAPAAPRPAPRLVVRIGLNRRVTRAGGTARAFTACMVQT